MNSELIREFAVSLPDVTEGFPFGEQTLVFKVNNKVFLLLALDASPLQFNVKCDPEQALNLREEYPDVILPGYHMNKKHWNTVIANGTLSRKQTLDMIANSYHLVKGKPKKAQ